ncbi:hypothetical protein NJR55_00385 [Idiomarina sp. M1R2S28]|uniref:Uncharacterized protein n=1 Tax=Idiomarina rhizosphaerae TaxID=2961572 RepID=A0A9X2FUU0_9GAMM|nr:hypothetical protein [Idiomarina rhizosphaerae]MCP1338035.1 hypothetical protein [Idiomarina rhizosphaerae]
MNYLKIYNLIRTLSIICFVAITFEYWGIGFIGTAIMLFPYGIVFVLANKNLYKTKLRTFFRAVAGLLVSVLTIGLLFGVDSDPQAAIGLGFVVVIQYGILFISEAIIGLATYAESHT